MRVQQTGLHFLLNGDLCLCCQRVRHQVLIPIILLLSIILLELKICNVKMFSSFMCFSLNDYNVHIPLTKGGTSSVWEISMKSDERHSWTGKGKEKTHLPTELARAAQEQWGNGYQSQYIQNNDVIPVIKLDHICVNILTYWAC